MALTLKHNDIRKDPDTNEYVLQGFISITLRIKIQNQSITVIEVIRVAALRLLELYAPSKTAKRKADI